MKPIVLSETEAAALQQFFRFLWLGYSEERKPIHQLLYRVDRYLAEREAEKVEALR